jgi:hypothetical protein
MFVLTAPVRRAAAQKCLAECHPGIMYDTLPAVHFRPAQNVPNPDLLAEPVSPKP